MPSSIPELELENQFCFALYSASRALTRAYGPVLGELGITYPQYLALLVLWEDDEPMPVGEIGGRLHLETGTLTPLLKRLEQLDLVTRTRDTSDERRVLIGLTPTGRKLRTKAADVPRRVFPQLGIDLDTLRSVKDELDQIVATLDTAANTAADPAAPPR
jgi:DNA-binding MarR family transcriptional regulator